MKNLNIYLSSSTDINNISIGDVICATDYKNTRHSNQYLKPEGGLYSYKEYVNYLVKRFKYNSVNAIMNRQIIWSWKSKQIIKKATK